MLMVYVSFNVKFTFLRRATEMAETAYVAEQLTDEAEGKHHIGDYLPPEELARFMEKVSFSFFPFLN